MTFIIEGNIRGQGRPRFSAKDGHPRAFESSKDKDNKSLIRARALDCMRIAGYDSCFPPERLGFMLRIETCLSIPSSWSKKRREAALKQRPQRKPDLDNLAKAVMDSLTGICYRDDTEVTELTVVRRWTSGTPFTLITISPILEEEKNG